ncbi:hypothetical protein MMC15_004853 [Xylographa vitiligo]|nr:hypothetical protein [Xylographa vitiligo]
MSSNGCSEKETAEKSSVLQDIESQAPVTSIDRVPAFQDNEKDGKPEDPTLVTWDGPDYPTNPKNWSIGKKLRATVIVSMFSFVGPLTSSMVAPALGNMAADLKMTNTIEIESSLSIFILAWAIAPFFLGPSSETYGRIHNLQISNLVFLAFNIGCGFAQNNVEIIPEQQGKAMGIYTLALILGSAFGPILGGWMAEKSTCRWIFWSTSIADAVVQIAGLFFLSETYSPTILQQKAVRLRRDPDNEKMHAEFEDKKLYKLLAVSLVRPFRLIGTQPIIQVLALYQAYIFGLFYLIFTSFTELFTNNYHESVGIASLNYIPLALGFILGTQLVARLSDPIYCRLKAKNNGIGKPEYRIPLMIPGALILIGLFWYGWSAQAQIHWIMPDIGVAIFGVGSILCLQCNLTYIIDSYRRYASSGLAAVVVLRSIAGFVFPMFAPYMYSTLDYG